MNTSFEKDLLDEWIKEMNDTPYEYLEPFLSDDVVGVIRMACTTLQQDEHVFIMCVEVLEKYIDMKNRKKEKIQDELLTTIVVLFVVSKYCGAGTDLKFPTVQKFLYKLSGTNYSFAKLTSTECEILNTLGQKLPTSTKLDDLKTFMEKYKMACKLKTSLVPLSMEILQLLYLSRTRWFEVLKEIYSDQSRIFKILICSKFYLPAGILMSALRLTNLQNLLNIDNITEDVMHFTKIHPDHINALSDTIIHIVNRCS